MIITLNKESNLKGYAFEYIARIILRRHKKNNFIFLSNRFDSIDEIISKYRINITTKQEPFIKLLRKEWNHFDIIEFEFNNKHERIVKNINIFDVKTKNSKVKRKYFESCVSNHEFFQECRKMNISVSIISILLFDNWSFSFNIVDYFKVPIRTYSNFKK